MGDDLLDSLLNDPLLSGVPVHEGCKVLGGVVLYQKLGAGGMGAVYRGRHLRLDIDVALKVTVLPAGTPAEHAAGFLQRFIREARTAAAVRHPNLIRVYDVNAEAGVHYLIMDYVEGESAADRLERKGRLSEQEAVEICLGAAEGLAAAHSQGIVHRDVKPDNILIDKKGNVVVADLGLAKAFGAGEGDAALSMGISLTQQAMGTPYYMSPEQTRSAKDVGPAADVWSLGVTLYELVSGAPPWRESDITDLINRIRNDPPPDVRGHCDGLSDGLCTLIDKALRKSPNERFTDCGETAEALREHLDSLKTSSESVLPDEEAGATKMALVSVTPPPSRTLTLIAEAELQPESARERSSVEATEQERPSARTGQTVPFGKSGHTGAVITVALVVLVLGLGAAFAAWRALSRTGRKANERSGGTTAGTGAPSQAERDAAYRKWMDKGLELKLDGKLAEAAQAYDEAAKYAPTGSAEAIDNARDCRVASYMKQAEEALQRGDYTSAIRYADMAVAADPKSVVNYGKRGWTKLGSGDVDGAIRDLDMEIQLTPGSPHARLNRGAAWVQKGNLDRAVGDFDKAIELNPGFALAYYNRGVAKSRKRDLEGAIRDLEKAAQLDPDFEDVHEELARAYLGRAFAKDGKGDSDGALEDYDKAIKNNPALMVAYYGRANVKKAKGDVDGAIADYTRAVAVDPDNWAAYYARAGAKETRGDVDGAIEDYTRAVEVDPDNAAAYFARGRASFLKGDWGDAIRDFGKVIELDPKDADGYYSLGLAKDRQGNLDGAIDDYKRALRVNPKHVSASTNLPLAYTQRGLAKLQESDFDGAIRDFDMALELDPRDATAYCLRGGAKDCSKDREGAFRDYDRAIQVDPTCALAYSRRGRLRLLKKDWHGAIQDCNKAIELNPRDVRAYVIRGVARGETGDRRGSEEDSETARRLGYSGTE